MKLACILLAYFAAFATALPKHGQSGSSSAAGGKNTQSVQNTKTHKTKSHSTNTAHTQGSATHGTGTATGSGSNTATGTQPASTGQSSGTADPQNVWEACDTAPNCKVQTGSNGSKEIVMSAMPAKQKRKQPKTSKASGASEGSAQPSSSSSASSSSSGDDSNDDDKTTYKTFINYSPSSVEWGCVDGENDLDIPGMVNSALESQCKSASCLSDGVQKSITWVQPDKGNVAPFGKSGTLTITPDGFYTPDTRDYFISAIKEYMGKGIQKYQQTHYEQKFKRDTNETGFDIRDESPNLGPDPQTKCWLFKQADQLSVNRFAYQNGQSQGGSQIKVGVTVDVDEGDGGFCGIITSLLGTLSGAIPGVGTAASTFFGLTHIACGDN